MLTEAQELTRALTESGLTPAQIGREIGAKAQQIRDIRRLKSSGGAHLDNLRNLATRYGTAARATIAPQDPGKDPGNDQADASGDGPALVIVDALDKPDDGRSAAAKMRDGLKAALLGGGDVFVPSPSSSSSSKKGKKGDGDFAEQITPIAAIAIVWVATWTLPDPYTPCAPTHAEASLIIAPFARIAQRELEIAGKMSERTMDILAALAAAALYGDRAHRTYQLIRREQHAQVASAPSSSSSNAYAVASSASGSSYAAPGGSVTPPVVDSGADVSRHHRAKAGRAGLRAISRAVGIGGGAEDGRQVPGQPDEQPSGGADVINRYLAADANGRLQRGLN